MKKLIGGGFVILLIVVNFLHLATAQDSKAQPKKVMQFIYVLRPISKLIEPANWTDRDNEIVARHFKRLQGFLKEDRLILAGRSLNNDPSTFGIVIFEANSEDEAREIMETDPAVTGKIMTAVLFPYRVALIRKQAKD